MRTKTADWVMQYHRRRGRRRRRRRRKKKRRRRRVIERGRGRGRSRRRKKYKRFFCNTRNKSVLIRFIFTNRAAKQTKRKRNKFIPFSKTNSTQNITPFSSRKSCTHFRTRRRRINWIKCQTENALNVFVSSLFPIIIIFFAPFPVKSVKNSG